MCLEVDKKWDDLFFLNLVITQLPSATKDLARSVLGHYSSHRDAYTKAISIKEGKRLFIVLPHKRGTQERMVVSEITVGTEITKYTCKDCLDLWNSFLVERLRIPRYRIQFCDAKPGNSTTLVFKIPHSFALGIEEKLSKPDVISVIKELGILRVRVPQLFNVDPRGMESMSMTKMCACMTCVSVWDCVGECACILASMHACFHCCAGYSLSMLLAMTVYYL